MTICETAGTDNSKRESHRATLSRRTLAGCERRKFIISKYEERKRERRERGLSRVQAFGRGISTDLVAVLFSFIASYSSSRTCWFSKTRNDEHAARASHANRPMHIHRRMARVPVHIRRHPCLDILLCTKRPQDINASNRIPRDFFLSPTPDNDKIDLRSSCMQPLPGALIDFSLYPRDTSSLTC